MAVEGSLDLFRLPEILVVISHERKTGILTVQGADDIVAVSFLDGEIVAADAPNETTEEGLGAVLVEEGRVPEDVFRRLASRAEVEGVRLADLLVDFGHVSRQGLLEGLRVQTSRLLLSLLEWRRGEFKFYAGDEVSYEQGFRSISVDELLLAAAQQRARDEPHDVPEQGTRLRRLEPGRPIRVRPAAGLDGAPPGVDSDSAVGLTPTEHRLLEAVEPGRTVEEVAHAAEVPLERARYVLYRFLRDELVATVGAPEPRVTALRPVTRPPEEREAAPEPARPEPKPEPEPEPEAEEREEAPGLAGRAAALLESARGARIAATAMALLAAALAVLAATMAWVAFVLPFPWLDQERAAFHDERDSAQLLEIDQAAKTFFLLEGRFPDDLGELVGLGLLEPGDVFDSRGRRMAYEPRERLYRVRPVSAAPQAPGEPFHEGIAGNFLLDPDFFSAGRAAAGADPPLVLLD